MKKVKQFIIVEHWGTIAYILLLGSIITLSILAFRPYGKNAALTIFYIVLISVFISGGLFFTGFAVWPILKDDHKENTLKVLITICIVLFLVSAILLSQFVFVSDEEYQEDVPYEVAENTCYVTDTGECYHKEWCHYLISKKEISLSTAKQEGYKPCSYCWSDYVTKYRAETRIKVNHDYVVSYVVSAVALIIISLSIILFFKTKWEKDIN